MTVTFYNMLQSIKIGTSLTKLSSLCEYIDNEYVAV